MENFYFKIFFMCLRMFKQYAKTSGPKLWESLKESWEQSYREEVKKSNVCTANIVIACT